MQKPDMSRIDHQTLSKMSEHAYLEEPGPFMIIYSDGYLEQYRDEAEVCEFIKSCLNQYGIEEETIAYVFCDGIQADYEYIVEDGMVVDVSLTPSDFNDDISNDDAVEAEMDREMELAMERDYGGGYGD